MPTRDRPFARGLVVANPAAGRVTDDLVEEVLARCRKHLDVVRLHRTMEVGDAARVVAAAARAADAERPDVVVSVGGDGTVREVVTGLIGAATPAGPALLVVPAGTGNSNYLAQWGAEPWPDAVDAALRGEGSRVRHLDLARIRERDQLVLLGAATGTVAEALQIARTVRVTGPARYQEAFTRACRDGVPYPGRVTVDGRVVHEGGTILVNVGGGRYRGGTYQLLPHSVLDDGELDVCVIGDGVDPLRVPELILAGDHVGEPGVVYARGRTITVERTDGAPIWFEHDGELLDRDRTAYTLDVVPGALAVACRFPNPAG
ncbi:diacylglycerol/lipid kinase family protein [Micromonospora siamensis]|uniref:Diacylglycerol kinase (ATP) n=1 Tax=Micromonospora siamensis TaxID=299152 RepID=A0A1C5HUN4_9ACTN|nr:diacylglycerol kinase family protein [Micromonospora siamensis]SCG49628.1 diacylglycerol kinase (ATP) [Micromonospora siamensis]